MYKPKKNFSFKEYESTWLMNNRGHKLLVSSGHMESVHQTIHSNSSTVGLTPMKIRKYILDIHFCEFYRLASKLLLTLSLLLF